jgi:CRP-like cAMP-binding protein
MALVPRHATVQPRNSWLSALIEEPALLRPFLRDVVLPSGSALYEPGALIEHVYFLFDAVVCRLVVMQGGEAITAAVIGGEAALGTEVALGRAHAIGKTVVLLTGRAARMPASEFRSAAMKSSVLRDLAIGSDAFQMEQALQAAGCNAIHSVEQRLSRCLLECSDRAGNALSVTQETLAQMLGVRRTTVTLVAHSLLSSGTIKYRRANIEIVDRAALEASACGCYRVLRQRAESLLPHGRTSPGQAYDN